MNDEIILKTFAERLLQLVKEHNTNINDLANKIGIKSKSTIYRYMNAEMAPKLTTIKYLAEIYDVNPVWLMGYDVPKKSIPLKVLILLFYLFLSYFIIFYFKIANDKVLVGLARFELAHA